MFFQVNKNTPVGVFLLSIYFFGEKREIKALFISGKVFFAIPNMYIISNIPKVFNIISAINHALWFFFDATHNA